MKYIVTAGGTGGHIYPGISIAQELHSKGHTVIFIASDRLIDHQIIDSLNLEFEVRHYKMNGINRRLNLTNIINNIINLVYIGLVFIKMQILLIKFKPDHVIGMGGYISFPIVFLAASTSVKTSIHEQNSYPGLVNRKLSRFVDTVFYTYKQSLEYMHDKPNKIFSSNPRSNIDQKVINNKSEEFILFVGGSLGASAINDIAFEYAKTTTNKVMLISGQRYYDELDKSMLLDNLSVMAYSDNLIELMSHASVVITRAGATTLIEIIALEKLCLAIPSPNVVANHQELNARELNNSGLINYILEEDLNINSFDIAINELINNKSKYVGNMHNANKINSLQIIIDKLEESND